MPSGTYLLVMLVVAGGIWGFGEVGHALKTGYKNIGCLITSGHRCPKPPAPVVQQDTP